MKHWILSIVVVCCLSGIAACAPKDMVQQPMAESAEATMAPTVAVQAETTTTESVSGEMQTTEAATLDVDALIREKLQGHHSIERVYAAQKTREEWNTTLDRMISYGAKISEEEKQIIIDYLLTR